jgi:hypothetical protein
VLDGGTGFLKVGYAAQVSANRSSLLSGVDMQMANEMYL